MYCTYQNLLYICIKLNAKQQDKMKTTTATELLNELFPFLSSEKTKVTREEYERLKEQDRQLTDFYAKNRNIIAKQSAAIDGNYSMTESEKQDYFIYLEELKKYGGFAFNVTEETYEIVD